MENTEFWASGLDIFFPGQTAPGRSDKVIFKRSEFAIRAKLRYKGEHYNRMVYLGRM